MRVDEQIVIDALHDIDARVPLELSNLARAGGRRRVMRRRAYVSAGVAVAVAVAVAIPLAMSIGSDEDALEPAKQQHVYPGLFAPPPAPGTQCNAGGGDEVQPTDYPDLLLLPPAGQDARALVRQQIWNCLTPHVALTALKTEGEVVTTGLVVAGPNAPTPEEVSRAGPGVQSAIPPDHLPIRGRSATEFVLPSQHATDVYWTEADGGQWHANAKGMDEAHAVELINTLILDSRAGTATLPGAAKDGWTIAPPDGTGAVSDGGLVYVDWRDQQGHAVDMTVMHGPDGVAEFAAGGPAGPYAIEGYRGPIEFVTVRGQRAAYGPGRIPVLFWQEAPNVEITLSIERADEAELRQVAESLQLTSPNDPRVSGG